MGEAVSSRKVQLVVLAAIAAMAVFFAVFASHQVAYAEGTEFPSGSKITTDAEYTVTSTGDNKEVAYTKFNEDNKMLRVPPNVLYEGDQNLKYKVTSIASKAFAGSTKAKRAIIGKNVKSIGANAFAGTNMTKLKINTKLLTKASVKNSLKGSKVKVLKVPADMVKAYKKIFTKANCGKKVTVKAQ